MKKIFFVEDDSDIQEIVQIVFGKNGYEVVSFYSGIDFINSMYYEADLIVLDKQLPKMDGLEICKNLKRDNRTKSIPVIIVSACPNIAALAKEAGAEACLEKPFQMKELREIVNRHLI